MNAKEKAEELLKKAQNCQWVDAEYGMDDTTAKNVALFAVDEILYYSKAHGFIGLTEYYEQVKQEIEKL